MRVGRSFVAAVVMAGALAATPTVHAAPPVGPGGDPPPPPQPGPITVQYRNGSGGLSSTTSIPVGSAFRSAGGSDRAPCTFMYLGLDPDGDGPLQPIYEPRESLQWMFRETTDTVVELTPEEWAAVAELGGTDVASVFATYGRVESAYRRFDVYCVGTQGSGTTTNSLVTSTLVSIRDVFWDPYARIGTLWTGLQLDRPVALTVPDSGLFGGLPVNMPATLQIDAPPWRTYVSAPSTYRGWTCGWCCRRTRWCSTCRSIPMTAQPRRSPSTAWKARRISRMRVRSHDGPATCLTSRSRGSTTRRVSGFRRNLASSP